MRWLSVLLTGAILGGFAWETSTHPTREGAAPFHARAARLVHTLPDQLGPWIAVERPEPPPAAQKLLRPNAIAVRRFQHMATNQSVTLIVVQCNDARDMGGHYPPVCYPAHGWQLVGSRGPVPHEIVVPGRSSGPDAAMRVPTMVYEFRKETLTRRNAVMIQSFFVIPGVGIAPDIKSVQRAAEDYRVRLNGATQVQIVLDADTPPSVGSEVFLDVIGRLAPLLTALSEDPEIATP